MTTVTGVSLLISSAPLASSAVNELVMNLIVL